MFDAVIFDFDGVILDSEPLHYEACCHVLEPLGISLPYEEYVEKYLGLSDKDMFPKLLHNKNYLFSADEINLIIHKKTTEYTNIINNHVHLPLIADFESFLYSMASQVKQIGICSGSTKNEITAVLTKVREGKLQSYFNTIVTSEDVRLGKPSPEGYLLCAKRLNSSPKNCLAIEDTPHGIEAAKTAGMYVIGLLTTYEKYQLSQADIVITGFKDLSNEYSSHIR